MTDQTHDPLVTALAEALDLDWTEFWTETGNVDARDGFHEVTYYLRAAAAILPRFLASPAFTEPTTREWLEHAKHGVESLDTLYHDGGADGRGITVREFRAGRDFILQQIDAALAALDGEPR